MENLDAFVVETMMKMTDTLYKKYPRVFDSVDQETLGKILGDAFFEGFKCSKECYKKIKEEKDGKEI